MSTTRSFKDQIDFPDWKPLSIAPTTATAGKYIASDLRNDGTREPNIWSLVSTTTLEKYNTYNNEWVTSQVFTSLGTASIGAGSFSFYAASHGPNGLVGGTPTTTSFTLAALPNSISCSINQLANKGNGVGYTMRVMGNGSGGSGKTEYVTITGNTASTTPVVTFTPALSFTPQTTDRYEILSGRVYLFGAGALSAGSFKAWDVCTNSISGNLTTTNFAASVSTDTCAVMLDELYVPSTRAPGEGFFGDLIGTAIANGTITGTVAGGDSAVLTNEFRNFQIRIVKDTAIPTAVGQRRKITSHTAGASPVYTLASNWTVNPSVGATFVVENANDVLCWSSAATVTYSYPAGGFAADASWSTAAVLGGGTQWANPPVAHAAGVVAESCFSITPDASKNARNSHIVWFKTTVLYQLDTAGGANGVWTTMTTYGGNQGASLATGTSSCHDAYSMSGRWMYISVNGTQRFMRFDLLNRVMEPWAYLRFPQTAGVVGGRMSCYPFIDPDDTTIKIGHLFVRGSSMVETFNCLVSR